MHNCLLLMLDTGESRSPHLKVGGSNFFTCRFWSQGIYLLNKSMFLSVSAGCNEKAAFSLPQPPQSLTKSSFLCCRQKQFEVGDSRVLPLNGSSRRQMTGSSQTAHFHPFSLWQNLTMLFNWLSALPGRIRGLAQRF